MSERIPTASSIQSWCIQYISKILDIAPERVDPTVEVERLGLDSSIAVAFIMSLEEELDLELLPELLFDYPTIAGLSEHLAGRVAEQQAS